MELDNDLVKDLNTDEVLKWNEEIMNCKKCNWLGKIIALESHLRKKSKSKYDMQFVLAEQDQFIKKQM
jgi:hypothetical protein